MNVINLIDMHSYISLMAQLLEYLNPFHIALTRNI